MLALEMLSEPVSVSDTYVSGLSHVEDVDGNLRFTFFSTRKSLHGGEEYTVEARLILSRQAVWQAVKLTLLQFGINCAGMACPMLVRRSMH